MVCRACRPSASPRNGTPMLTASTMGSTYSAESRLRTLRVVTSS